MPVFRYTLQASTFQMAVLLQFNTETSWTVQQLHDFTSIQMDMLKQVSLGPPPRWSPPYTWRRCG